MKWLFYQLNTMAVAPGAAPGSRVPMVCEVFSVATRC